MTAGRKDVTGSPGAIAFAAALLAGTLVLLATTARLTPSAALVPRVVGVPLALLLAWVLAREVRVRAAARATPSEARPTDRTGELTAIVWLVALPALATALGFVAGPAVWVFAWIRFRGGERTGVAIGAAAVTGVVIVVVFGELLGVRLPHGVLERLR